MFSGAFLHPSSRKFVFFSKCPWLVFRVKAALRSLFDSPWSSRNVRSVLANSREESFSNLRNRKFVVLLLRL
jgi:hypothetical protein